MDRLGRKTQYTYDVLNRPTQISYADAVVTLAYNAAGLPTQVDDSQGGTISWDYTAANQLLSETTAAGIVHYTYNTAGQLLSMTAADRSPVNYGYDTAGRLQTIQQGSETYTHTYDQLSRRTGLLRPNGVATSYTYDTVGRVSRLTHSNALNQPLEDYQYTFTADDQIDSIVSLSPAGPHPEEVTVGPADAANRVRQFGPNTYDFDAVGQTTRKTDASGTTQYSWDARGRLTGASLPGGQNVNYTYDALNRQTSRSAGGATTQFVYDGPEVVIDRNSSGSVVDYLQGVGIDEHLRQSSPAGVLYSLQDHLGSVAALTDTGGNVVERQQYEPFGRSNGSSLTRFGFTGRERDSATGLLNYRARWYDSQQGRFLSEDPAGLSAGTNLYSYAANNPILFNDPFGLSPMSFLKGLWDGIVEGFGSGLVAGFVFTTLTGMVGATGGAILAVIGALLLAYGLYAIWEEAKAIAEIWDRCPDERDYRLGKLIGSIAGALVGGAAGGAMAPKGGGGAGGGAGNRGGGCSTCKSGESCFVEGTLVQTSSGEKRIEEVQAGDGVLSFNPEQSNSTAQPEWQSVSRTFVRTAPVVLDIHIGKTVITATPEHPFWVIGAGWTAAGELRRGSALLTKDGVVVHVDYVDRREGLFRVYNFEVANTHTYYVSSLGLLVHNNCGGKPISNDATSNPRTGSGLKNDQVKPIRDANGDIVKEFPAQPKAHGFPDIVDNYAGQAQQFNLNNGAKLLQLEGSNNGVAGRFEWIIQNGAVTHRMFVQGGTINGIPTKP
jgi:RHS repeat-associated protein